MSTENYLVKWDYIEKQSGDKIHEDSGILKIDPVLDMEKQIMTKVEQNPAVICRITAITKI